MSSPFRPVARRTHKRRGAHESKRSIHIGIDLNSPAPAADISNVASSSGSFQNAQFNLSPIYVDDADDDVQMISASRLEPLETIIVLDEEEEINLGPSGVAREERYGVVTLDLSLDLEMFGSSRMETPNPRTNLIPADPKTNLIPAEPLRPPPMEPTFNCPVCMNPLVEPSSTICGHIFCKECIKASIQAQKKCPTCRKQLNLKNFHRVYLPSTE